MLSTGAFNALLKTLEEPPANGLHFSNDRSSWRASHDYFATQRFNPCRITAADLFKRMAYILEQKNDLRSSCVKSDC